MDPTIRKAIIQSISIVVAISLSLGLAVGLIFQSISIGIGFSILSVVFQFLLSYLTGTRRDENNIKEMEIVLNNLMKEATELKTPVSISCAYCKATDDIPISLLEENVFECTKCNMTNKVFIQFTTTRVTQPLFKKIESKDVELIDDNETVRQSTINEPIKVT